jgi:hypothetical protein
MDLLDDPALLALGGQAVAGAPGSAPPCHVCLVRPGRSQCRACGKRSCAADTWVMFSLCKACVGEKDLERWHRAPQPAGKNWLEEA